MICKMEKNIGKMSNIEMLTQGCYATPFFCVPVRVVPGFIFQPNFFACPCVQRAIKFFRALNELNLTLQMQLKKMNQFI